MTQKQDETLNISLSNTKKEIIEAYNRLKKEIVQQAETELKPEKKKEERKEKEAILQADAVHSSDIHSNINALKSDIGNTLSQLAGKLEAEAMKYQHIREAIEIKKKEMTEIFEIEKEAATLAALIEAHKQKKNELEHDLAAKKEALTLEIETTREEWKKEQKDRAELLKERETDESKKRTREKEEYEYNFKRKQEFEKNKLKDELEKLEKDIITKREVFDKEIADKELELLNREKKVAEREQNIDELQQKVTSFPEELEDKLNQAIKDTTTRLQEEAKMKEALFKKEADGKINVLQTKIEALEKVVTQQNQNLQTTTAQIEAAYAKVQEIALRAVQGSANQQTIAVIEQMLEKNRSKSQE